MGELFSLETGKTVLLFNAPPACCGVFGYSRKNYVMKQCFLLTVHIFCNNIYLVILNNKTVGMKCEGKEVTE